VIIPVPHICTSPICVWNCFPNYICFLYSEDVDMSDESEDEMDSLSAVTKGKHDLLVKTETKVQTGFFKSNKKQYPMFPFFEEKVKFDEYGEIIRYE